MLVYIGRRVLLMIPTLIVISMVSFFLIQLPPGDYLDSYAASLRQQGDMVQQDAIDTMRERYGLGQPVYVQYAKWVWGIVTRGDFGQSMEWQKPVSALIWERIGLTILLACFALMISWFVAIPVGVYSATHQYSLPDYVMSGISFLAWGSRVSSWR
jgi:peptide/nickel transport system permease protein